MTLTLTFAGHSSTLHSTFLDPIHLEGKWSCGLLTFEAYNSIPNVDETNNKIYIVTRELTFTEQEVSNLWQLQENIQNILPEGVSLKIELVQNKVKFTCSKVLFNYEDNLLRDLGFVDKVLEPGIEHVGEYDFKRITHRNIIVGDMITIPVGSYEFEDLAKILKLNEIEILADRNTGKCSLKSVHTIDMEPENSIGSLLGFKPRILEKNIDHVSEALVNIFKVNAIFVECSIVTGTYINGRDSHILHQFFPTVAPGYKIVEVPTNIVYLNLLTDTLNSVSLKITDQEGRPVNFRGETITVRLHLKRDS